MMCKVAALAVLILGLGHAPADAEARVTLGWGRMFTNDTLGDGNDRWRSGSYTVSRVRGLSWSDSAPATFGELLEFRARAEVIAPESLLFQPAGDRRYAGVLSFGLHSHVQRGIWQASAGVDLVMTGDQTGMSKLQGHLHDILGYAQPLVAATQIGNGFHPTLVVEAAPDLRLTPDLTLRPYVEAQAGLETFVRAGFDLSFGSFGQTALMVREQVTGQRYRAVEGTIDPGLTFTLGGDIAHVFNSELLPEGGAAVLSESRSRLRAGVAWQGERASVFYGVTWLGPEFDGQRDDQMVGSLSLRLNF